VIGSFRFHLTRGITGIGAAMAGVAPFRDPALAALPERGAFCRRDPGVRSARPGLFSVSPSGTETFDDRSCFPGEAQGPGGAGET